MNAIEQARENEIRELRESIRAGRRAHERREDVLIRNAIFDLCQRERLDLIRGIGDLCRDLVVARRRQDRRERIRNTVRAVLRAVCFF